MRSSWGLQKYARKYSSFESQYSSTLGSDLRHVLIDHGRSSSFTINDGIWSIVESDSTRILELAIIITCKEKVTLEVSLALNLEHGNSHLQRHVLVQYLTVLVGGGCLTTSLR